MFGHDNCWLDSICEPSLVLFASVSRLTLNNILSHVSVLDCQNVSNLDRGLVQVHCRARHRALGHGHKPDSPVRERSQGDFSPT